MILQRLVEYAERNGLGFDQTYSDKRIYWQIELDGTGKFLGITPRGMGEKKHTGEDIPAPYTSQSLLQGGKISHFILDSSERTLLWYEPDITSAKLAKIKTQNKYFWRLVEECYQVSTQNKIQLKAFLDSRQDVIKIV